MDTSARLSRIDFLSRVLLLIFIFSLSEPTAYAFSPAPTKFLGEENKWTFHSEVKGVKIYYQISACNNRGVVYLKFNNTNKETVKISWKEAFYTKQVPEEKDSYIGLKQLTLPPGEVYQSNCGNVMVKECITFSYEAIPTYIADITEFKIKDIHVTPS